LGNRIRTILPDGRQIDYLYYGSGHLHQISLDGEVITDIERDKLHREIQRTQGSISSLYDYDPMGRLKSQRTVWSGTPTSRGKQNPLAGGAVNRRYAYDKAGNLIQSADQRSGVLNYVYDKIGRIQEARNSQSGRSETFAFDPAHNILDIPTSTPSPVGEGKTTAPISEDPKTQGRLKSPANPNSVSGNRLKEYNGIEYTYDALGNLIYRQLPDGENQYYQYDLENQLVRAEIKKPAGNTEIWEYAYDPFGRRLSKERKDKLAWTSTEPKRTHFVWDGSRLLQEYTYKGCYTYIYTDQDSYEPLAQIFDNAKDGKQYFAYFHNDQIGIPREMTDIHGNLLWYGEYTAWGRLKKDERVYKNAHQPFRLQNQYYDEETGLHYNLMRYYEPEAGRFVNQDPIKLIGGDNLYQFALNTQAWIDPWGLVRLIRYKPRDTISAQNGARGTAIDRAWREEKALVEAGGGTRNWTQAERDLILNTKNKNLTSVMSGAGYTGHHINSVELGSLGQKWKGDPRNIVFLPNSNHPGGVDEHLHSNQGHRGRWTNLGRGRLIDRRAMLQQLKKCTR